MPNDKEKAGTSSPAESRGRSISQLIEDVRKCVTEDGEARSSMTLEKISSLELLESVRKHKPKGSMSQSSEDLMSYSEEIRSSVLRDYRKASQSESNIIVFDPTEASWIGRDKTKLLSQDMASIFIIGNSLAGFLFELPYTLMKTGWSGVYLILLVALNSFYSGFLLGRCWMSMEKQWPKYKGYYRTPYSEIGYMVGGYWLKILVTIVLIVQQTGLCTIKYLLLSKFIDRFLGENVSLCLIIITCGITMVPFTFYESPKDYKNLGKLIFGSACVILLLGIVILWMEKERVGLVTYVDHSNLNSFYIIGTLLTAFNAGTVYPSIQIDMQNRKVFRQSLFTSYLVLVYLYVPLAVLSYGVYGDLVKPDLMMNFFENEKLEALVIVVQMMCIALLFITLVLQLNPLSLTVEEVLNVPPEFTYKRCLVRAFVSVFTVLLLMKSNYMIGFLVYARNIAMILMTFTFPAVFFIVLEYRRGKTNQKAKIKKKEWFFLFEMTLFSIVGLYSSWLAFNHKLLTMKHLGFDCYNGTEFRNHHLRFDF